MRERDRFEGRSWLNILAALTLLVGLVFPMVSGLDWPSFRDILVWYALVFILTFVIASAARTQERLARIEDELGLNRDSETETAQDSEP